MQVGINCLGLDPGYVGGVNTYTLGLLGGLAALPASAHRFKLFVSPRNAPLFERFAQAPCFSLEIVEEAAARWRKVVPKFAEFTRSPGLYRQAVDGTYAAVARTMERGCDFLYTPATVLRPFRSGRPQLLSMHDIQHVHFPQFFSRAERRWRRLSYVASARCADWLQASSDFIKQDLLAHFAGLRPEQVVVIPEGVAIDAFRARGEGASVLARHALPERFLYYPAQLWPHKNHLTLLKALKRVRDAHGEELPLVLTGAPYDAAPAIFAFVAEQGLRQVRHLGTVPFAEVAALYRASWFTITAVLYESSSLCLLEGAAAGAPLIASRTPPNVEMSRVLEMNLFDPLDDEALARLLWDLWDDLPRRDAQRRANAERVHHYSWDNAARRYVDFFDAVSGGGRV